MRIAQGHISRKKVVWTSMSFLFPQLGTQLGFSIFSIFLLPLILLSRENLWGPSSTSPGQALAQDYLSSKAIQAQLPLLGPGLAQDWLRTGPALGWLWIICLYSSRITTHREACSCNILASGQKGRAQERVEPQASRWDFILSHMSQRIWVSFVDHREQMFSKSHWQTNPRLPLLLPPAQKVSPKADFLPQLWAISSAQVN
jgi:hypothetical protein